MHKGVVIHDLLRQFPRLSLERLPAYSPELNPIEQVWKHLKYDELSNFVPDDVNQLDRAATTRLRALQHNQKKLESFFNASELPRPKWKMKC